MTTKQQIPCGDDSQKNNDNYKNNDTNPRRSLAEAEDGVGDVGFFE